jgi:hypothetical protein
MTNYYATTHLLNQRNYVSEKKETLLIYQNGLKYYMSESLWAIKITV